MDVPVLKDDRLGEAVMLEYRHVHTRAMGMLSAMPSYSTVSPAGRTAAMMIASYALHLHAAKAESALVCDFYRPAGYT